MEQLLSDVNGAAKIDRGIKRLELGILTVHSVLLGGISLELSAAK